MVAEQPASELARPRVFTAASASNSRTRACVAVPVHGRADRLGPCPTCFLSTAVQVPDIYDSAKYDAIHNRELGLDLQALYEARVAVCLAFPEQLERAFEGRNETWFRVELCSMPKAQKRCCVHSVRSGATHVWRLDHRLQARFRILSC